MKQYNSTYFRRFMNKVFNTCEESCEPVLITTRKDDRDEPQQMVIISKAQYDMIMDKINAHSDVRDNYGNPPNYKSTFIADSIASAVERIKVNGDK